MIDPATLTPLLIAGATPLHDRSGEQQTQIPPLLVQAQEKLKAAELLVEQRRFTSAVELLVSAMPLTIAAQDRPQTSPCP